MHNQHILTSSRSTSSQHLIVFYVVCHEIIALGISVNVDVIPSLISKSNISEALSIAARPKERHWAIWLHLAKHVESSVRSLVLGSGPMSNSNAFAKVPGWERSNISSCEDIGIRCLHKGIGLDGAVLCIHFESSVGSEPCVKLCTCGNDY